MPASRAAGGGDHDDFSFSSLWRRTGCADCTTSFSAPGEDTSTTDAASTSTAGSSSSSSDSDAGATSGSTSVIPASQSSGSSTSSSSSSGQSSTSTSNTDTDTNTDTNTDTDTDGFTSSTSFIQTVITTSIPTTITEPSTTFTSFSPTTLTSSFGVLVSQTAPANVGSVSQVNQPVCIGNGIDVQAVGILSTLVIPSLIGLLIWLAFAFLRPRFRQVYSVREWFPPQNMRPEPLRDSLWAFLFPHVPFVPSLPGEDALADVSAARDVPSDGQLSQRVLWICFLIVAGWSLVGLLGALPLYLVNTPCLSDSLPQASFGGVYSTLQDLSVLRLLQLLENGDVSTGQSDFVTRATVNGNDVTANIRTRLIILTVFVIVLAMLPALWKLLHEYLKLVKYRRHWLEVKCEGLELGWLSAQKAPGLANWGEKRVKEFISKVGLSAALDKNVGGLGTGGPMAGIGSGYRARTLSERLGTSEKRAARDNEKAALEVDVRSLFTISDSGPLPALIEERDYILGQLEMAEAKYISSFRLSTPETSMEDLNPPPEENQSSLKMRISRPRALGGKKTHTSKGRRTRTGASTAPTSYVAPPQYYRLRNVRGIDDGRGSQSGGSSIQEGPSFGDSVRSRIVGSRFQEFSGDHDDEPLPIGSRVTLQQGELNAAPALMPAYGPNHGHGMDPSSGNEGDVETSFMSGSNEREDAMSSVQGASGGDRSRSPESPSFVLVGSAMSGTPRESTLGRRESGVRNSEALESTSSPQPRPTKPEQPVERRETFPMRPRDPNVDHDVEVPLHLRVQAQGPFVRPVSGVDHDMLGSVYSDIGGWRTKLKQINADIMDAQNESYNDIASGQKTKGWLLTGRGIRFIPGVELIDGRSKDDIVWTELQSRKGFWERRFVFWCIVAMAAILLAAAFIAVAGLVVSTAPDVSHYLPFFQSATNSSELLGPGILSTLVAATIASLFFFLSIRLIIFGARFNGHISRSASQLSVYKATFLVLILVGFMWLTAVGALIFSMGAFATGNEESSTVANGSIYISAFFLALVFNVAVIIPGLLLLQPSRLRKVLWRERRAITPRQKFRALYPRPYNATYATACCILAVILASAFSLIFPLIGPAVVILLILTIVAHRFLVGYVYGRTDAQTSGLLQTWLLIRFADVVALQPILLGLIFLTRRLWPEGGVLIGVGVFAILAVEAFAHWKTRLPGRKSLSTSTLSALDKFQEKAGRDDKGSETETAGLVSSGAQRQRSRRGSMSSVLDMMSFTLAVMPTPHQLRGAVPLETESLDDLTATERAARTHPDAPPHLPPLAFADHAEEMAGILYAPELIAPAPTIWLPNDPAGIAKSEAYDLQRYHGLRTTLDVRSYDDANVRRSMDYS